MLPVPAPSPAIKLDLKIAALLLDSELGRLNNDVIDVTSLDLNYCLLAHDVMLGLPKCKRLRCLSITIHAVSCKIQDVALKSMKKNILSRNWYRRQARNSMMHSNASSHARSKFL